MIELSQVLAWAWWLLLAVGAFYGLKPVLRELLFGPASDGSSEAELARHERLVGDALAELRAAREYAEDTGDWEFVERAAVRVDRLMGTRHGGSR